MSGDINDDMPKPGVGCHRTGFEKDCRDLVTSGRCRRWKVIPLEDTEKGAFIKNFCACVDDYPYFQNLLLLKKADNTTVAIQQGNKEAQQRDTKRMAIDVQVLGTVMDATQRIKLAGEAIEDARQLDHRQEQLALTVKV